MTDTMLKHPKLVRSRWLKRLFVVVAVLMVSQPAKLVASVTTTQQVITFNDVIDGTPVLSAGQIVDDEFSGSPFNLAISGVNISSGPDLIVAFDTFETNTADPDLQDPFDRGNADRIIAGFTEDLVLSEDILRGRRAPGNGDEIGENSRFGIALIIQENGTEDPSNPGFIDTRPDDEGSRPAGSIFFDFEDSITEIGFDVLDVEGPEEFGQDAGFVAAFLDELGNVLAQVGFDEFLEGGFFENEENQVEFGDNSANRIAPITAEQLSEFTGSTIESFNRVELNLGGSGAVDNLTFAFAAEPPPDTMPVPEATSFAVWLMLALAAGSTNRRWLA